MKQKKAQPAKLRSAEKSESKAAAEKLLEELTAKNPRLNATRIREHHADDIENGSDDDTVQIYRQKLKK